MNTRQILLWGFLTLIIAQIVFYEQLNAAFDSWRMRGCERVKDIDAYDLQINPTNGDLWGISYDSLFQFDGSKWHIHSVRSLKAGYITEATIVFDPQGRMWHGGWNGVGVFDGENWTFYNEQDWGLYDTAVTSIAFDPTGRPWVGFSATGASPAGTCGGISILDGGQWITYPFGDVSFTGPGCQNIQSIQFDASGNAWLGLSSGVLMILEKAPDETFHSALPGGPEFSSTVRSTGYFLSLEDAFPTGSEQGPTIIKDFFTKSRSNQLTVDGLIVGSIDSIIFDARGKTWVNAGSKLYQLEGDRPRLARSPTKSTVTDAQGNLWSIGQEIGMYDGKSWTIYHRGNSCIGNEDVGAMAFDKNNRAWVSRFPDSEEDFSLLTFDEPPPRVPDVLLRARAIFLPPLNSWLRWMGPILLAGAWLLVFLGAKWPACTFPLLDLTLALASERIHNGQYNPTFIFELCTLFSLGGGMVSVLVSGREGKVGFWKNAAPGFYGTLICMLLLLIAGFLWNVFGPSS